MSAQLFNITPGVLATDSGYARAVVKRAQISIAALLLAACSSSSSGKGAGFTDSGFTNCNIRGLTGNWKFHYEQQSGGNCGPLRDEEVVISVFLNLSEDVCTVDSRSFSEDKCQMDTRYECPTPDQAGTQSWNITLHQVAAEQLMGTATTKVNHPTAGTCQSTYTLTVSRLASADAGD